MFIEYLLFKVKKAKILTGFRLYFYGAVPPIYSKKVNGFDVHKAFINCVVPLIYSKKREKSFLCIMVSSELH